MSHVVVSPCSIRDLEALGIACENKNVELVMGQKTFKAWSTGKCEHAIRVKQANAYEAGLVANPDGGWSLAFDNDMPGSQPMINACGRGLVGLQNEYLAVVAERQLRREGWMVERRDEGERIQLRAYA